MPSVCALGLWGFLCANTAIVKDKAVNTKPLTRWRSLLVAACIVVCLEMEAIPFPSNCLIVFVLYVLLVCLRQFESCFACQRFWEVPVVDVSCELPWRATR